jgi:translation initiation factor IF-3
VRVINAEGGMLGVMPTNKALEAAREVGMDLVEVAPNERPPVCKIIDFGKFKYTQKKRLSKQKQHQVQIKEIRVRPKTGDHDIEVKVKRAKEFLEAKDKVLVNVLFRGRELQHIEEGKRIIDQILERLADCCKVEKAPSMEGFLFPATYEFPPDVTAAEVLTATTDRGAKAYAALNIPEAKLRTVVIKASIIQAEAGNKKYMGPVSRVLDNRLKINKKLQLDSTVSYATGRFNVTTTPADRQSPSRFNTYRYAGLPAGPIDNPGESAIEAAAKPAAGNWTYFVTVNPSTGATKFTNDYNQHLANVKEFQAWCQANKGQC